MTATDNRKLDMIAEDVASIIAWHAESPQSNGALMLGGQRWHFATQDGASLLLHRWDRALERNIRITIAVEEY